MATVDDVNNLVNAVNQTTLKRMEDKADKNHRQLMDGIIQLHMDIAKIQKNLGIPQG
jgi:uncharacterized protein Yka (UPF0111/DUF47 family)